MNDGPMKAHSPPFEPDAAQFEDLRREIAGWARKWGLQIADADDFASDVILESLGKDDPVRYARVVRRFRLNDYWKKTRTVEPRGLPGSETGDEPTRYTFVPHLVREWLLSPVADPADETESRIALQAIVKKLEPEDFALLWWTSQGYLSHDIKNLWASARFAPPAPNAELVRKRISRIRARLSNDRY